MAEETTDYGKFDADWYFDHYYGSAKAQENMLMDVQEMHILCKKYNVKGKRLLDVGTGPVIQSIFSASQYVDEIYLSDFAPQNCDHLRQWLQGKKETPKKLIQGLLQLEESKISVEEMENAIRKKVKAILHIDVNAPKPLGSWSDVAQFDVITTVGCLEAAADTVGGFERGLVNITSLLKSGGFITLEGGIGGSQYKVGNYIFKTLTISEPEVKAAVRKAGLITLHYHQVPATQQDLEFYKYSSWYYIVAIKE